MSKSRLDILFDRYEAEELRKVIQRPASSFKSRQRLPKVQANRIKKALTDFWYFDSTYFPPDSHSDTWSKPGLLHRTIKKASERNGIHWFATHRETAKTRYMYKIRIWQFLRGDIQIGGVLTKDLRRSRLIIEGYEYILTENPRLQEDFEFKIIKSNDDHLRFRSNINHKICALSPFSDERTLRGEGQFLERPDFCDVDDLETLKSNFGDEQVEKRIDLLVESFKSLKSEVANMLVLSNNLHPRCAFNKLYRDYDKGIVKNNFFLYPFPDWSRKKTDLIHYLGSVWKERFPAKNEKDMRIMRNITDDYEWSQAQCNPKLRSGHIFPEKHFHTYSKLPDDAKGAAFIDQNNSKKGSGDTTAMGALLYSPSQNKYYAYKVRCKSYSDPNQLLDDYFSIQFADSPATRIYLLGMDGNVSQESTWESYIRNWCMIKGKPAPPVVFKRYRVDDLIDMARTIYIDNLVRFEEDFSKSEEGERFKEQFFGFEGKKAGKTDDAPDWFISCFYFGLEMGYFTPKSQSGNDYQVRAYTPTLGSY